MDWYFLQIGIVCVLVLPMGWYCLWLGIVYGLVRNHKEVKSARDPIVGPPDRPGNRVHCPAPVLTRPLNPQILVQIQRNKVDTFQLVG